MNFRKITAANITKALAEAAQASCWASCRKITRENHYLNIGRQAVGGLGGPLRKITAEKFLLNIAAMSFVVGEPLRPKKYWEKAFTKYIAIVWTGGPFLAAETSRLHMETQSNGVRRRLQEKFFLPLIN